MNGCSRRSHNSSHEMVSNVSPYRTNCVSSAAPLPSTLQPQTSYFHSAVGYVKLEGTSVASHHLVLNMKHTPLISSISKSFIPLCWFHKATVARVASALLPTVQNYQSFDKYISISSCEPTSHAAGAGQLRRLDPVAHPLAIQERSDDRNCAGKGSMDIPTQS